ncbi:MAG TPA: hypothetical protein VFL59_11300, partial [Candidatus Nanopelagicales bacterium]|nr:hypothetical protein [Candidatus Nanopelagicales bacterium]
QQKTAGLVDIEDSAADGSATWTTGWGQRITIAPRPFLHDPADRPPPDALPPRPPAEPPPGDRAEVQPPWRDPGMPPF